MQAPIQYRKNRLRTDALYTESALHQLRQTLDALKGDMDPGEFRAASESLRRAESAVESIKQMADWIGAEQ